jgi:predicted ester cyclase
MRNSIFVLLFFFVSASGAFCQSSDSLEQRNIKLVKDFYAEAWNSNNAAYADEVFAHPYIRHDGSDVQGNQPDTSSQSLIAKEVRSRFKNFSLVPQFLVARHDMVVARWTMTGEPTGIGRYLSMGTNVSATGVNIFKIKEDKIVEIWNNRDDYTIMKQVGIIRLEAIKGFLVGSVFIGTLWYFSRRRHKNKLRIAQSRYTNS